MTKRKKEQIIFKGSHLKITKDESGKEIFEWDWKKLEAQIKKSISEFNKKK